MGTAGGGVPGAVQADQMTYRPLAVYKLLVGYFNPRRTVWAIAPNNQEKKVEGFSYILDYDASRRNAEPPVAWDYEIVKTIRLTRREAELLVDASVEGGCHVGEKDRAATRLVYRGLARWEDGDPESGWIYAEVEITNRDEYTT